MRERVVGWVRSNARVVVAVSAVVAILATAVAAMLVAGGSEPDVRLSADGAVTTSTTELETTTSTTVGDDEPAATTTTVAELQAPASTLVAKPPPPTPPMPVVLADGTWRVGPDVAPGWYVQTAPGPCTWTVVVADGRSTSQLSEWMADQAFQLQEGSTFTTQGCRFEARDVPIDNDGGLFQAVAAKRGPTPGEPMGSFVTGRDVHRGNWVVDGFDEHRSSDCPKESCEARCIIRVRTAWGLKLSEPYQVRPSEDVRFSTLPPMVLEVIGESCPRWKVEGR